MDAAGNLTVKGRTRKRSGSTGDQYPARDAGHALGRSRESRRGDSNPGPPPYHGGALPAELRRRWLQPNRLEWGEQDSNLRRQCHAVYSRVPLATRTSPRGSRESIVERGPVARRLRENAARGDSPPRQPTTTPRPPASSPKPSSTTRLAGGRAEARGATGASSPSATTAPPSRSSARYGGPIYGAFRDGAARRRRRDLRCRPYPPPAGAPWPGTSSPSSPPVPAPIVRGLQAGERPGQRSSRGRRTSTSGSSPSTRSISAAASAARCSRACIEDAEAPVYLDTANPANVPYYASFGFEEIGRAALPRGATMWFMRRP